MASVVSGQLTFIVIPNPDTQLSAFINDLFICFSGYFYRERQNSDRFYYLSLPSGFPLLLAEFPLFPQS